jgi:hypothetical protein
LAVHARCGIPNLPRAVVVDGSTSDYRVHPVADGECIVESSEHYDAAAVPPDSAVSVYIESVAVTVRGEDAAICVEVACALRNDD